MKSRDLKFVNRLGFRMGLTIALSACLALGATVWVLMGFWRDTLTREVTLRLLSATESLAVACSLPLLDQDPELQLHPLITKALDDTEDINELIVIDRLGVIQGHRELLQIGNTLSVPVAPGDMILPLGQNKGAWVEGDEIVITQTIFHLDRPIGTLVAKAGRSSIDGSVRSSVQRLALLAGTGMAFMLMLTLSLLSHGLSPLAELRRSVRKIGEGELGTQAQVKSSNELGLLAESINAMSSRLQEAQKEHIEKARLDQELAIARDIQNSLLPQDLVMPDGYRLAAHYTPAREVSGDYFDVMTLDDGSVAMVVADVSGKGVPGLVLMAMLRAVLRSLGSSRKRPAEVLKAANKMIEANIGPEMFITCLYGILDPVANRFTYTSAGHCYPLQYGGQEESRWLPAGGKAIGMFPTPWFEKSLVEQEVELQPGEGLVLYTDGLTEAQDAHRLQLGKDEVMRCADKGQDQEPEQLLKAMVRRVDAHRGDYYATDDITLLAFRRDEAGSLPRERTA